MSVVPPSSPKNLSPVWLSRVQARWKSAPDEFLLRHGIHDVVKENPQAWAQSLRRHQRVLSESIRLSSELTRSGVPHVFLKGFALQELLYREVGARPYSDVDLLVPPSYAAMAADVVCARGWGDAPRHSGHSFHFHRRFQPVSTCLPLELHFQWIDNANLYRLPRDAGFENIAFCGDFPILSTQNQFLYLCLHAQKHGFLNETAEAMGLPDEWFLSPISGNRLIWWLDIALLLAVEGARLDLQTCVRRIIEWRIERPVAGALRMVARFLPESPAKEFLHMLKLQDLKPARGGPLMRMLARGHFRASTSPHSRGWRWARLAEMPDLLFPPARILAGYLGKKKVGALDRVKHTTTVIRRLAGN